MDRRRDARSREAQHKYAGLTERRADVSVAYVDRVVLVRTSGRLPIRPRLEVGAICEHCRMASTKESVIAFWRPVLLWSRADDRRARRR
jgi:hypothetical protein